MSAGVVVGRFQVNEMTEGHMTLLQFVHKQHPDNMLVLIGVAVTPNNSDNPMDFRTRSMMIQMVCPGAIVLPVVDHISDQAWSRQLDNLIELTFPEQRATLYGGRDSFIPHYFGRYPTRPLDFGADTSGTAVREAIANAPRNSSDFRAGIIYGITNLKPRIYMAVDIGLFNDHGQVLLGRKIGSNYWRFPGGFVDMADQSLATAAKRELYEETTITLESEPIAVGSFTIDDWRCRGAKDVKVMSELFFARHSWGVPKAGDDLNEAKWWTLNKLPDIAPEHKPLMEAYIAFTEKLKYDTAVTVLLDPLT